MYKQSAMMPATTPVHTKPNPFRSSHPQKIESGGNALRMVMKTAMATAIARYIPHITLREPSGFIIGQLTLPFDAVLEQMVSLFS